ncbi:MAG TPA: hypothetical protein VE914_05045 [Candidatus Angelobacter sp.]|nr:hypothetical protein [Candidatus Angelobacter sp.]
MLSKSIKGVAFSGMLIAGMAAVATVASSATALPGETTYVPMQAISHDLGSKAAIGYFVREAGACQVVMMIGEKADAESASMSSAARLRLALLPGQRAGVDSEEGRSIDLTCGEAAATLIVRNGPTAEIAPLTN